MTKGLDIVLKDVSYERRALGYDLPVKEGCLGWWFLGGDKDFSAINLAEGMPDAVLVGSPGVSPAYLSLKSKSNYLRTQQITTPRITYVAVWRSLDTNADAAHRPVVVGSSDGSTTGASLIASNVSSVQFVTYQADDTQETTTATAVLADWKCSIASADENEQTLYNMTLGTSITEAQSTVGLALAPSSGKIGIGSGASDASVYGGMADIAMIAIYDRVLTSDERTAIYNRVKTYLANRGITI